MQQRAPLTFLILWRPACSAYGYVFDQPAFILSHKRKDKIAAFLQQFRNSQAGLAGAGRGGVGL